MRTVYNRIVISNKMSEQNIKDHRKNVKSIYKNKQP